MTRFADLYLKPAYAFLRLAYSARVIEFDLPERRILNTDAFAPVSRPASALS